MFVRTVIRRLPSSTSSQLVNEFHSTSKLNGDVTVHRQARMLKKMMTGSNRSRKKFFNVDLVPSKQFGELQFLNPQADKKRSMSSRGKKRVKVLNVLFVEQVTSLLSTGEIDQEILDLGLQISAVKISNEFNKVNIYWEPSGSPNDEILEKRLPMVAGKLRHQLTQLRVIGNVPPIVFTRDPFQDRIAQIERSLEKCDFGPDFVPTSMSAIVKSMKPIPVNQNVTLTPDLIHKINEKVSQEEEKEEKKAKVNQNREKMTDNEELKNNNDNYTMVMDESILNQSVEDILHGPEMRNDILGLNQSAMMQKIINAVENEKTKKSKSPNSIVTDGFEQGFGDTEVDDEQSLENIEDEVETQKERTTQFLKYLKERRIQQEKERKRNSCEAKDKEFQEELRRERLMTYREMLLDDIDPDSDTVDDNDFGRDFIEEDFEREYAKISKDHKTRP